MFCNYRNEPVAKETLEVAEVAEETLEARLAVENVELQRLLERYRNELAVKDKMCEMTKAKYRSEKSKRMNASKNEKYAKKVVEKSRKRKSEPDPAEPGPSSPKLRKIAADLKEKQTRRRGEHAWQKLEALAVGDNKDINKDESVKKLLVTMCKQRPELMKTVYNEANIQRNQLTPRETEAMFQQCQMTMTSGRSMRSGLNKFNLNMMCSEKKLRKYRATLFDRKELDIQYVNLEQSADVLAIKPVLRINKLIPYLEKTIGDLEIDTAKTPAKYKDHYIILLSGDKGGNYTKFYFSITNLKQDKYSTHMYCMYTGTESYPNMKNAWSDHYEEEVI